MIFDNISIIGRVAYCIYSLELYLSENGYDLLKFDMVFNALWSFSDMEYVDDYLYKVIECSPDIIFDEQEDFTTFDYFSENELINIKNIYTSIDSKHIEVVNYLMEAINDILSTHMYAGNTIPAQHSLDLMENEIAPYIKKHIKNYPPVDKFSVYDINENHCWGIFYSREYLFS